MERESEKREREGINVEQRNARAVISVMCDWGMLLHVITSLRLVPNRTSIPTLAPQSYACVKTRSSMQNSDNARTLYFSCRRRV